jgi:hypothetical protein
MGLYFKILIKMCKFLEFFKFNSPSYVNSSNLHLCEEEVLNCDKIITIMENNVIRIKRMG